MHHHRLARIHPASPIVATLAAMLVLSACNRQPEVDASKSAGDTVGATGLATEDKDNATLIISTTAATDLPPDTRGNEASLEALVPSSEIPYPVYPNGSKYRVGGEHGLKIVVFETSDTFEQVDAFYAAHSDANGMPRLAAMGDYVRYSSGQDDDDPWATDRPGIVVHEFENDSERQAVGAREGARTNIIMSY